MDIRELQTRAHALAVNKGWWPYPVNPDGEGFRLPADAMGAKLALVHSEVSEALETVRDGELNTYWVWAGIVDRDPATRHPEAKPEGLPSELADIVIRVADFAGACGIDLQAAIEMKMDYNATRKHRHGGRAL